MKRFRFRYENILRMRMDEEEAVKGKLKQLTNELSEVEAQLNATVHEFSDYQYQLNQRMKYGVRGMELKEISQYQAFFRNKIANIRTQIAFLEDRIEAVKMELVEAMKERKIMEKLKEKDEKLHMEEANAAENKVIDEIVNFQNSKRSGD